MNQLAKWPRFSPLKPKEHEAIGRVVVEFAHLEATIQQGIWFLLGVSAGTGLKVTADLMASNRVKLLLALAHEAHAKASDQPKVYKDLKALEKRLGELAGERNSVVHLDWMIDPFIKHSFSSIKASTRKKVLEQNLVVQSRKKLEELADNIAQMNAKVFEVLSDHAQVVNDQLAAAHKRK